MGNGDPIEEHELTLPNDWLEFASYWPSSGRLEFKFYSRQQGYDC